MSEAPLAIHACRQMCAWRPARHALSSEVRGPLPLFRCRGCGSEWVRSEPWAPVDANGARHPALVEEIGRRLRPDAGQGPPPGSGKTPGSSPAPRAG